MAQLYFQQKRFLWELSKTRFYGWLTLALWALFSVFNVGIVVGLLWQYLSLMVSFFAVFLYESPDRGIHAAFSTPVGPGDYGRCQWPDPDSS